MSDFAFILGFILLGIALYLYIQKKWDKRQAQIDEFAFEMHKEFAQAKTTTINSGINFYKKIQDLYESREYTVTKHPDYTTDFICKKGKNIAFLRAGKNSETISATTLQTFIGQTVMYALENPLYESYKLTWIYISPDNFTDQSARIFINKHKEMLKLEQVDL